jgi:hypothetical protein
LPYEFATTQMKNASTPTIGARIRIAPMSDAPGTGEGLD